MADDFDGKHQGREPQDGSEKMFEVFDSVGLDPVIMSREEYHQGTGYCRIQIVRGGQEPRDQPEQVGEKDEESQGPDQGQEFPVPGVPMMSSKNFRTISVKSSKIFPRVNRSDGTSASSGDLETTIFRKAR